MKVAKEAIEQGADVLVVQGGDAGGHQWGQGASIMALVPEVKGLLCETGRPTDVGVVAAGGIVDGKGCVAALGLGKLICGRPIYFHAVLQECPVQYPCVPLLIK